jgi:DNA gyrase/topoisomerase IV subunit B
MVYIAQPPLYRVYKKSDPSKHIYCWDEKKTRPEAQSQNRRRLRHQPL